MPNGSRRRYSLSAGRTTADFWRGAVLYIGSAVMIATASAEERPALQYGIYDPEERFAKSDQIGVEHIFVHWEPSDVGRLRSASDYAASRNRWLMVTVEPRPAHSRHGEPLLTDITDGIYDSDLANIGSALGELNRPVFVRWGHEMEDLTGRYPWASRDAEAYIKAYRYFVDRCRLWSHGRFYFVWSPKGRQSMSAYYPADEYVDYFGVSRYQLDQSDNDTHAKPPTFTHH